MPTIVVKFDPTPPHESNPAYEEYMSSPEWAARRVIAIQAAGGRCVMCNSPFDLEVHHRTYKHFGNEPQEDLTCVCHSCHRLFHDNSNLFQF